MSKEFFKKDLQNKRKLCTIIQSQQPPVAKLDIAVDSDSKGWGFKSLRAGQQQRLPFGGVFAVLSSDVTQSPRRQSLQRFCAYGIL